MRKGNIVFILLLSITLTLVSSASASALRFFSLPNSSTIKVKEGGPSAQWTTIIQDNGVLDVAVTDNRVAYIDSQYRLWVKEGGLGAYWTLLANNVYQVELRGNDIFALDWNFQLMVKQGSVNAYWTALQYDTYFFALSDNRILSLSEYDGYASRLAVKEGTVNAQWATLAFPVSSYGGDFSSPSIAVTDNRIAYFEGDYDGFTLKEGSIHASWYSFIYSGFGFNVEMAGDKICINKANEVSAELICKEGPWYAQFIKVHNDAFITDLRTDRIAIRTISNNPSYSANSLMLLEGALLQNSGWKHLDNGFSLGISRY